MYTVVHIRTCNEYQVRIEIGKISYSVDTYAAA